MNMAVVGLLQKTLGSISVKNTKSGLEGTFCRWIARQMLAEKDLCFRRHRHGEVPPTCHLQDATHTHTHTNTQITNTHTHTQTRKTLEC